MRGGQLGLAWYNCLKTSAGYRGHSCTLCLTLVRVDSLLILRTHWEEHHTTPGLALLTATLVSTGYLLPCADCITVVERFPPNTVGEIENTSTWGEGGGLAVSTGWCDRHQGQEGVHHHVGICLQIRDQLCV